MAAAAPIEPITRMPEDGLWLRWRSAFFGVIEAAEVADPLRETGVPGRLREWTSNLTSAVVRSCESLGLAAAGKGRPLDLLAESRQEYLGLDVTAYLPSSAEMPSWPYPLMAFELENSMKDDRIAYSIWKVASVRAKLGVVFAYRKTWDEANILVSTLAKAVPEGFGPEWGEESDSEIVLAVGSRSENEAFPWGYFKFWAFNRNTRRFEKM